MTSHEQLRIKALEQAVELVKNRSMPASAEDVKHAAEVFIAFLEPRRSS